MLLFGAFVHHGIEIEVVHHAEGFFDEATTTEPPGGSHDFGGKDFFEGSFRGEFIHEFDEGLGIFFLFAFAEEIAGGVEAGADCVAGRFLLALFGPGATEQIEVKNICEWLTAFGHNGA